MKTLLIGTLIIMSTIAYGGTVKIGWTPYTGAAGFNVYVNGVKNGPFTNNSSASVSVVNGINSIYVTAFNAWGESPPSNTVTTPPILSTAPAGTKLTITATGLIISGP